MTFPLRRMKLRVFSYGRYSPRMGTRGRAVRIDEETHRPRRHLGWDLLAHIGTPVLAISDGWITWRGPVEGYGLLLQLKFEHRGKYYWALYAHLSRASYALTWVKEGTVLGHTGTSGWEKEARNYPREHHLHFEIRGNPSLARAHAGTLLGTVDPGKILGYYMYPYALGPVPANPPRTLWNRLVDSLLGERSDPS